MPAKTASHSKNIYQRLLAAMEEVKYILKDRPKGMQYAVVSHDAVTKKVRPALMRHGIVYLPTVVEHGQDGNRTSVLVNVKFVNVDTPEDCIEVNMLGYGVDSQDKGPGKAISYAVKYALLKALGLETGEDADLDSVDFDPEGNGSETTVQSADVRNNVPTKDYYAAMKVQSKAKDKAYDLDGMPPTRLLNALCIIARYHCGDSGEEFFRRKYPLNPDGTLQQDNMVHLRRDFDKVKRQAATMQALLDDGNEEAYTALLEWADPVLSLAQNDFDEGFDSVTKREAVEA